MRLSSSPFLLLVMTALCVIVSSGAAAGTGHAASVGSTGNEPAPLPVSVERDIVYRTTNDGIDLTLDIWTRAHTNRRQPVVMLVHGGGWRSGDKREWEQASWPASIARRGYVVFNVNYRLACPASTQRFKPASAELCGHSMTEARYDVREALRWVYRHAASRNASRDRISLFGGSAGAQLAMLIGTETGVPRVRSVIAISPPAHLPWFGNRLPAPRLQDALNTAIGCHFRNCRAAWRSFSPSTHVDRGRTPPTYAYVSGSDTATPIAQARVYERALKRAGVKHTWRTSRHPGERCHGTKMCLDTALDGTDRKLRADAFAFLAEND